MSSVIENCVINPRSNQKDPMFYVRKDGSCEVNLIGYAIIPLEEYEDLKIQKVIVIEPLDNREREECFWCKNPTKVVYRFSDLYNFCPKCKK